MNLENMEWLYGEIEEDTKKLKIEFVPIDEKEFQEKEIDITEIISQEELIEKINNGIYDENKYIKIILIGNKKIEINTNEIIKHILHQNIIKIKDKTKLEIDLEKLSEQNNLKGIFVKNLLEKIKENPEQKEKIEKAIEIGLNSFLY